MPLELHFGLFVRSTFIPPALTNNAFSDIDHVRPSIPPDSFAESRQLTASHVGSCDSYWHHTLKIHAQIVEARQVWQSMHTSKHTGNSATTHTEHDAEYTSSFGPGSVTSDDCTRCSNCGAFQTLGPGPSAQKEKDSQRLGVGPRRL